jgi:hypothetical protein
MATDLVSVVDSWLEEHAKERRALAFKAGKAYAALANKDGAYALGIAACTDAHRLAAEVYERALVNLRREREFRAAAPASEPRGAQEAERG